MWNKIDIDSSGSISCEEFRRAIVPYVDQVTKERNDMLEAGFIPRRGSFATRSSSSFTTRSVNAAISAAGGPGGPSSQMIGTKVKSNVAKSLKKDSLNEGPGFS